MRLWAAMTALMLLAACGESEGTSTASPSPTPSAARSPSSSAAPSLKFTLNAALTGATASGAITVTVRLETVTVQLDIKGLGANSSHVSHIHLGSCAERGGIMFALNQVVADGTGAGVARTTLRAVYPPKTGHWYVVVHAGADMQGTNASYLLCGNLFA